MTKIRSTTILGVRHGKKIALGGDGQVTFGDMQMKQKAVKVRQFDHEKNKVLGGFAGAAADAFTLFEKFEDKLDEYNGQLQRAVVELAKEWRTDKHLRHLPRLLAGTDAAINLVGILNEKGHDGSGFRKVHVELVEKLVRACHESRVPHLLQMSALKANAESGPSHYLRSKGAGERTLKNLAGDELRYTIFQPSVIFGPEDSFINRFAGLLRICPILPLARPKARFAPVSVADVASAFCAALENHSAYDRTFQLYGPEDYSLREIVVEIARILNLKRLIVGLPGSLSRIQAWFLDYVIPGKLFTLDNYRSMAVASVGTENGLAALGITATSMRAVVPGYLDRGDHYRLLSEFRRKRRR